MGGLSFARQLGNAQLGQGLPDLAGDTANDLAKDFAGLGIRKRRIKETEQVHALLHVCTEARASGEIPSLVGRKMDDFRQMPQVAGLSDSEIEDVGVEVRVRDRTSEVWGSSVYCVGHPRVAIMGMWSWHGLATRGTLAK